MFKKTLIAASLATLSINAFAVDTKTASATNAQTYGSEALTSGLVANNGTVLTLGGVVLTAGAQYSVGDIITVTIDGGKFANTTYTLTDTPATNNDALTFGLLNKTDTTLTFRITALTSGTNNSTIGNTFALAGTGGTGIAANGVVLTSTAAKAAVNVTAKAETSTGIKIDSTANDTVKIGEVIAEHALAVDPVMDAIIDVTKLRKEFKDATKAKFVVKHTYTSADQANFEDAAAKIKYMVNGSMVGYSDTTAFDGKLADGTVDYVVAADKESASTTYTQDLTGGALADKTLTFTVGTTDAKREVLTAGKYSVTGSITIGTKSIDLGTKAAGEMKLNGSSFDLSYVPYGDSVEQFIWVTNKGTLAGEITVTGFDQNGETYGPYDLGTVDGGKLAKLDADLKAKLVADGVTNERVSLNVTVNAPTGNVEVFAAYKVISANDRLTLPVKSLN